MTVSERTPGPLRCVRNPYDGMYQVVNEHGMVACLGTWQEDGTLFAAAPSLLEAAKTGLDLAREMLEGPYDSEAVQEIIAQLEATIARAEGRE